MYLKIFFDGACEPFNPGGRAGFGWIAYIAGKCIAQNHGFLGEGPAMSNNVAEYGALIEAMRWVEFVHPDATLVEFFGDSSLVIAQMSGQKKIGSGLYVPYARQAQTLNRSVYRFTWIPREQNEEADALSKLGCEHPGWRT